jgi:hypothetical protein
MSRGRFALVVSVLVSAVVSLMIAAAGASAASGDHFTCRASALRVQGLGVLNVEPAVSNSADNPCRGDHAQVASVSVPTLLTSGVASATTSAAVGRGSAAGQVASVSVPPLALTANAASASAGYGCSNGALSSAGGSEVVNLRIGGGAPITTSASVSQSVTLAVGGVARVGLNRAVRTASSITRRAVDITILGGPYNGAEIVLGEATADLVGNPCVTGTSGLQPPTITGAPPASSPSSSATFTFVSTTVGATFQCRLDNAPFAPCNSTTTFDHLSLGPHTLSVREVLNGVVGPVLIFRWKVVTPANRARPVIFGTAKAGRTLRCGTGRWSNHPTRFSYRWSRNGTPIAGASNQTYKVRSSDEGLRLTCTVRAYNAAGASRSATSRSVAVAVPFVRRCPRATGRLNGQTLGLVRLGMTRAQARRAFTRSSDRGKRFQDFFCLTPIGVRVGYASDALLKTLSFHERNRVRGRVILALTANAFYAVRGVRPGATLAAAQRALGKGNVFHVGRNFWYLSRHGTWTATLKVRHGIVEEVGTANPQLTRTRKAQRTFIKSFS